MISRRAFLTTAGASVVVAGAGTALWARGPGQAVAREPWKQAGESFGDPRLDALAYAILAPNPHNRQPWQFELIGDRGVRITCDLERRLPHTDPFDRQITIGFGCMIELLSQAALSLGYRVNPMLFPAGESVESLDARPIAEVEFVEDMSAPTDPLFEHVLQRRSLKEPFDTSQPVEQGALDVLLQAKRGAHLVQGTNDSDQVARLRKICMDGWMVEYETDRTRRESIELMRIGNRVIAKNPDGIDMGGTMMGLLNMAGFVTQSALDEPGSVAYDSGVDMYRGIIDSAMGFVWIHAPDNSRSGQIAAGRDWVRINLAAQSIGLGVHPLSQVLQEFPEMAPHYASLRGELGAEGDEVIHMLGRVGYAAFTPPSPRWPLESRLLVQ